MPNQLGIIHPALFDWLQPNFYPSLLTIQAAIEGRSPTGAVTYAFTAVADMVDLPCRIAPQSGGESRTLQQVLTENMYTCVVPLELIVTTLHRAIVDGAPPYDIHSVEYDGQNTPPGLPGGARRSTRLTLKVVT